MVKKAGFDGVEIEAAHGLLVDQSKYVLEVKVDPSFEKSLIWKNL